jgi:ribA/ribD-fused uncharacterized protein
MNYKFFWGGVFSNFHPINGDQAFTSEKIFMGLKGAAFHDLVALQNIRVASNPRDAKNAGRSVRNFSEEKWADLKVPAMMFALEIKFSACEEFRVALKESYDKNETLVEASPDDKIWGIGFRAADALANKAKWGTNLLGECLMSLRRNHFKVR